MTPELVYPSHQVTPDDTAVVYCPDALAFPPGHPLRAVACLICGDPIGDEPAGLIGIAALTGPPFECGAIRSDVWMVHGEHLPLQADQLQAAITRGLQCGEPHQ